MSTPYRAHDGAIGQIRRAAMTAPMLDVETEREYLRRCREGDGQALHALLLSHLRLVLSIAQSYAKHGVGIEDLVAEGNLGLVEAARRFDPARGSRFSTYASWWVRALMRRYTIANRRIVGAPSTRNARKLLAGMRSTQRRLAQQYGAQPTRAEVAEAMGVAPKDVDMVEAALTGRDVPLGPTDDGQLIELADYGFTPEQAAVDDQYRKQTRSSIGNALEGLDEREREIVRRRLLEEERATLATLGARLGLSREGVRQIELRARRKLRAALLECVA